VVCVGVVAFVVVVGVGPVSVAGGVAAGFVTVGVVPVGVVTVGFVIVGTVYVVPPTVALPPPHPASTETSATVATPPAVPQRANDRRCGCVTALVMR
jgi:hypothetical protein